MKSLPGELLRSLLRLALRSTLEWLYFYSAKLPNQIIIRFNEILIVITRNCV